MASFGEVRAAGVNRPYGPSTLTMVPTGSSVSRSVPAPRSRRVMRAAPSVGTAEREIGCECHQVARVQNRQTKNCPPTEPRVFRSCPARCSDTTPGATDSTPTTRMRCRRLDTTGSMKRKVAIEPSATTYSVIQ